MKITTGLLRVETKISGLLSLLIVCKDLLRIYCSFSADDARLPVSVYEFQDYVKSMHKNTDHLFSEEYEVCSHMVVT